MLVNNSENNIDVYLLPHTGLFTKTEQKKLLVIDISKKGMISSCVTKNKILVGCRDGTLFEIETDTFKITRAYLADKAVAAIEYLNSFLADSYVISQSMPSGYLDPRSRIDIVVSHALSKEELIHFYTLVLPAGDIQKIL